MIQVSSGQAVEVAVEALVLAHDVARRLEEAAEGLGGGLGLAVRGPGGFAPCHLLCQGLCRIQQGLQLLHGLPQLVGPAEGRDDLPHGPVRGNRRDVEDVRQDELGVAVLGVFLQQLVQNLPRLGAVPVKKVFALGAQLLCPLPAGAQRGVEGEVAEQVEGDRRRAAGWLPPARRS